MTLQGLSPDDHTILPTGHQSVAPARVGVLLVNLGTPEAPTAQAVRRFLREFLSDRRVVDYPRLLWLPILHGVILNVRPARSARAYAKIWSDEGSPLRQHTRALAESLQARMGERCLVDYAMRYGAPSIADRIGALEQKGATRLLVAPLYPQYAQSTTASVADAVAAALASLDWRPALRIAAPFYDRPAYIAAVKSRIEAHFGALGWTAERTLLSFHGAPKRQLLAGDPYYCHCAKTARLIREAMGWTEEFAPLCFQSKFGREEWLGPATDSLIRSAAAAGVKRLAVVTPGFMADCLETLEEIAIGGHEAFLAGGGEKFAVAPCLNASAAAGDLVANLIETEAAGWL